MVLSDMKIAPKAGLITIPCLYKMPAANGSAIMLYPVAQARFCTIVAVIHMLVFIQSVYPSIFAEI